MSSIKHQTEDPGGSSGLPEVSGFNQGPKAENICLILAESDHTKIHSYNLSGYTD